jgi:hypothetical protein
LTHRLGLLAERLAERPGDPGGLVSAAGCTTYSARLAALGKAAEK